ncbi:hypothetical protein Norbert_57 [Paenibacillus phage Norbert]|uniref:DUF7167 domain-containing protein n=7 Tax=Fernvirus TaxID=2843380 RepID=A0A345KQL5_9CAUD|nr:hypothetical protein HWB48_gp53 [Paenibacillus phage Likha]YP_009838961.1 hypothetical protein HWB74_gp58 [Paenibacillus phage Jacopo]AXF40070.1 hypothetical protein BLOOM_58 [Paenibacillus phage Bloom]AXF40429.1 hypothetical protein LYCANUS1_58 [Paenibacillus phage Genki]AXF42296.1 hypothetical protein LYCANUS2_58 [Paenibacillus phage Gryphonian]AXH45317.1 hypothetical protein ARCTICFREEZE_58 [Paenibacillus phage Arcticfreeze]AXH45383.1 hypothetical protein DEVRI_58 [Paenibacillus phage D
MKIKYRLSIGYPGAVREDEVEIDDEELEGLTPEEAEDRICDIVNEHVQDFISLSWEEVEE